MKRDPVIDNLRFVGITLIVLAHVTPPNLILFNARAFDVPLMLFVSGLAYSGKSVEVKWNFFIHRFLRLVVPVYLFLTLYFVLAGAMKFMAGIDFGITTRHIVGSYLLMEGIGFVWIIRVFLMVAMLTPWLVRLEARIKSDAQFAVLLVALAVAQEVLLVSHAGLGNPFVRDFVYYAVGYSLLFLLGLRLQRASSRWSWLTGCVVLFVTVLLLVWLQKWSIWVNDYKYPPRLYFMAYGAVASVACFLTMRSKPLRRKTHLVTFIGQNTIWIYLWHIPLIQLTGMLHLAWHVRFLLVYVLSVAVVWVQVALVNHCQTTHKNLTLLKYLKG